MADDAVALLDSRIWPVEKYISSHCRQGISAEIARQSGLCAETIYPLLEVPKSGGNGHFSLPIPKLKLSGVNAVACAQNYAANFVIRDKLISKVTSTGPFLNFTLDNRLLINSVIREVIKEGKAYGHCAIGKDRRVGIEFSSVNIAKPFHAGHLRGTILGNFLTHVYRACGFDVVAINYLGDWGRQYGLLAVAFEKYGDEAELQRNPIEHLFGLYVRINKEMKEEEAQGNSTNNNNTNDNNNNNNSTEGVEEGHQETSSIASAARAAFKKMEDGDADALKVWRRFRDLSIVDFKLTYARLNVAFDEYSGESFYSQAMLECVAELKQRQLLIESKGAWVVDLSPQGLGMPLVIKSDGATLYLTRDLAAAGDRFVRHNLEKSIYVVAMQQELHLKQLFCILKKLDRPWSSAMLHVGHGLVKGMSTRKGQVVIINDILDEAAELIHSIMRQNETKYAEVTNPRETCEILALSAIVVRDMSVKRMKDYEFCMEQVVRFEGDTGPYLQFAHCRLASIERKSGFNVAEEVARGEQGGNAATGPDFGDLLVEPEAFELALYLSRFPDVVQEARINAEPCVIVSYLMGLGRLVSAAMDVLWVKGQEERLGKARCALYTAARIVLGNGLLLLGLIPLERM